MEKIAGKFQIGERVKMNQLAIEHKFNRVSSEDLRTGVVKNYTDSQYLVNIQRDGEDYERRYHVDFWEKE